MTLQQTTKSVVLMMMMMTQSWPLIIWTLMTKIWIFSMMIEDVSISVSIQQRIFFMSSMNLSLLFSKYLTCWINIQQEEIDLVYLIHNTEKLRLRGSASRMFCEKILSCWAIYHILHTMLQAEQSEAPHKVFRGVLSVHEESIGIPTFYTVCFWCIKNFFFW